MDAEKALKIDSLTFFFVLVYFLTLVSALILFQVLEKRHKMKIKRLQIFIAAMLGIGVLVVNLMSNLGGALVLELMNEPTPLPAYPQTALLQNNIMQTVSLSFVILTTIFQVYLVLKVGLAGNST